MYQHSSTVNASQEVNFDTCIIRLLVVAVFLKFFQHLFLIITNFLLFLNYIQHTYMYSKHPYLVGCLGPANLPQNENPGLFAQM